MYDTTDKKNPIPETTGALKNLCKYFMYCGTVAEYFSNNILYFLNTLID